MFEDASTGSEDELMEGGDMREPDVGLREPTKSVPHFDAERRP